MIWKWLTVVGLSMTPALIAGQSAAILAAIGFGFSPWLYLPIVVVASFIGGVLVMWLADLSARIPWLKRLLGKLHKPKAVRWCERWGPWGGLIVGAAVVGPIPILIALKWMLVEDRRIYWPLGVSSVLFTIVYYLVIIFGLDQMDNVLDQLQLY